MELSRWLYHHGYPYKDVLDQLKLGAGLCSADSVKGLDQLLQINIMISQCTGEVEYILKSVGCVLKLMKVCNIIMFIVISYY